MAHPNVLLCEAVVVDIVFWPSLLCRKVAKHKAKDERGVLRAVCTEHFREQMESAA